MDRWIDGCLYVYILHAAVLWCRVRGGDGGGDGRQLQRVGARAAARRVGGGEATNIGRHLRVQG